MHRVTSAAAEACFPLDAFMCAYPAVPRIPHQVYKTAWRACGIDSMIVPTTQKFMINHLGFFYVLKYPTDR